MTTKDRYKRFVAWVYLHDLCINEKMVATGYAWQYIKYSDDRELARLERIARNERRGLWRDDNPTPPWEWRSKKKPKRISRKVTRNKNLRPVKASRVETSTLKLIEQYSMDIQSRIAQNWDMRGFYTNRKDFKTVIIVKISKDGNIDKIMFEHKSGNSYFDDQCFEAVKKSGPFSPLPDSWKRDHFELAVGFTPKGLSR